MSDIPANNLFDEEGINLAYRDASSTLSRRTIVYMSPKDFLRIAEPFTPSELNLSVIKKVMETGRKIASLPYIIFDNNGNGTASVVGHEGRHRMFIFQSAGIDKIPVVLHSREGGAGQAIRWGAKLPDPFPVVLIGEADHSCHQIDMPESLIFPWRDRISPALSENNPDATKQVRHRLR